MQPKFYIRLTSDSSAGINAKVWTLRVAGDGSQGEQGEQSEQGVSTATALDELATAASGCRVIVIVPATDLLLTSAAVPSRNRQRIINAVPYLLEDQLASDVEQLHFVIDTPDPAGQVATLVVEHHKMQQWLELLREYGVEPHMIVADLCCLPVVDGQGWSLLLEAEIALLSTGQNRGFAVDRENLVLMLRSALQESEKGAGLPEQLHLITADEAASDQALHEVLAKSDLMVSTEEGVSDTLALLVRGLNEKQSLNLLQGQYSRRDQIGKMLRPWRAAAAMLAALLLFSSGMTVGDYFELNQQQAALKKHIEQTYLAACPGAKRVVNPKAQMEQCLKKLRGGGGTSGDGLLMMLSLVGEALKAASGLQLQRISYRNGQIDMALAIADIQGLDQLKQRIIKDAGLQVEILSATSRDNRIEARLQLKGKGA